jgi:hypothetical protein
MVRSCPSPLGHVAPVLAGHPIGEVWIPVAPPATSVVEVRRAGPGCSDMTWRLLVNGGQDPDPTRCADDAPEAIRSLNHGTRLPAADAVTRPADVYLLLGSLSLLAGRLPQVLAQLQGCLERELAWRSPRRQRRQVTRSRPRVSPESSDTARRTHART